MRKGFPALVSICLCLSLAGCAGGLSSAQSQASAGSAAPAAAEASPQAAAKPEPTEKDYQDVPLAPASKDGKSWQYIDGDGNVVLDLPRCQDAKPFRGGKAIVLKDGKYFFIDKKGQDAGALNLDCVEIGNFSQGMACFSVKSDDPQYPCRYGFIDETGKVVVEPVFVLPPLFIGDFARVLFPSGLLPGQQSGDAVAGTGCYDKYYLDRQGRIFDFSRNSSRDAWTDRSEILLQELDTSGNFGSELLAYMDADRGKFVWKSGSGFKNTDGMRFAFKNTLNEAVIGKAFENAREFIGGLAPVQEAGKKWGFIDESGNYAIEPQFDDASRFSQGLAAVKAGDKWGYVDKTGKYAIQPQFDDAEVFSEGLAPVCVGDKWGYIDKNGAFAVQPAYDAAEPFMNGVAPVARDNGSGSYQWGLIDKKGRVARKLSAPDYNGFTEYAGYANDASFMNNEGIRVAKYSYDENKDKFLIAYIGDDGVLIKPHEWYDATNFSRKGLAGVLLYDRNGKYGDYGVWGIIDKKGKYIVQPSLTLDEMLMQVFGYDTKGTDKDIEQLSFLAASGEQLPPLTGSLAGVDCRKLLLYLLAGQKLPPLSDTPAGLGEAAEGYVMYEENGVYGFRNASDGAVAVPARYQKASYFGR